MIAADADCEHIALQLAAARKALDRAFYEMVSCMIRAQAPAGAAARREHAKKVAELLARFG
jgi:DNA-binding FrmR family transcriptional regulator